MRFGFADSDGFSQFKVALTIKDDKKKQEAVEVGREELSRKQKTVGLLQARLDKSAKPFDYLDDDSFWEAFVGCSAAAKLVSARWLVAYAKQKNATLPRRQDLPPDAFIKAEILRKMYMDAPKTRTGSERRLPVLGVMEFWHELPRPEPNEPEVEDEPPPSQQQQQQQQRPSLSPLPAGDVPYDQLAVGTAEFQAIAEAKRQERIRRRSLELERINALPREYYDCPDPDGVNLQEIARVIRENLSVFSMFGYKDVGVYLDRVSCHQAPRALSEIAPYKRSQKLTALWFAHSLATCLLCVNVPKWQAPIETRGWPMFARACAWLCKDVDGENSDWPRVIELGSGESVVQATKPPPAEYGAFEAGGSLSEEVSGVKFGSEEERSAASECYNRALTDALGCLRVLQYAHLGWGDDEMARLGKVLPLCVAAEKLYLDGNERLSELPSSLGSLSELRTLFLTGCTSLLDMPASLGELRRLQTLYLSGCAALRSLPESIAECIELRELDLSRCEALRRLPARLGELANLQMLLLSGCSALEAMPHKMPASLLSLQASGCRSLGELPERLSGAPPKVPLIFSPRSASGDRGEQMSLSLEVHVAREYPMRELCLYGCLSLIALPASIGALGQLELLDLGNCSSLATLPESLSELARLERLNLGGCAMLRAMPPVGRLTSLRTLDLRGCRSLVALPQGLDELDELRTLQLEGCSLLPSAVRLTSVRPMRNDSRHALGTASLLQLMKENAEPYRPPPQDEEQTAGEEGEERAGGAEGLHQSPSQSRTPTPHRLRSEQLADFLQTGEMNDQADDDKQLPASEPNFATRKLQSPDRLRRDGSGGATPPPERSL